MMSLSMGRRRKPASVGKHCGPELANDDAGGFYANRWHECLTSVVTPFRAVAIITHGLMAPEFVRIPWPGRGRPHEACSHRKPPPASADSTYTRAPLHTCKVSETWYVLSFLRGGR